VELVKAHLEIKQGSRQTEYSKPDSQPGDVDNRVNFVPQDVANGYG